MIQSAKLLGAVLAIAALAPIEPASAACVGNINAEFSACSGGGASGQAQKNIIRGTVIADVGTGAQANAVLYDLRGNTIPRRTCDRPQDTAPGIGVRSAGSEKACAVALKIQVVAG